MFKHILQAKNSWFHLQEKKTYQNNDRARMRKGNKYHQFTLAFSMEILRKNKSHSTSWHIKQYNLSKAHREAARVALKASTFVICCCLRMIHNFRRKKLQRLIKALIFSETIFSTETAKTSFLCSNNRKLLIFPKILSFSFTKNILSAILNTIVRIGVKLMIAVRTKH